MIHLLIYGRVGYSNICNKVITKCMDNGYSIRSTEKCQYWQTNLADDDWWCLGRVESLLVNPESNCVCEERLPKYILSSPEIQSDERRIVDLHDSVAGFEATVAINSTTVLDALNVEALKGRNCGSVQYEEIGALG